MNEEPKSFAVVALGVQGNLPKSSQGWTRRFPTYEEAVLALHDSGFRNSQDYRDRLRVIRFRVVPGIGRKADKFEALEVFPSPIVGLSPTQIDRRRISLPRPPRK